MKKIYFSLIALCIGSVAFAQSSGQPARKVNSNAVAYPLNPQVKSAALGDTLLFFDGNSFYITDPTDAADFASEFVDVDQLVPAVSQYTTEWMGFYSVDPAAFMPGDGDTAYYVGAVSWFNPAGIADNWITFGPITIPATGAEISFYNRSNPGYADGFQVFVSTTGTGPYTDFDPAVDTPIFAKADCHTPGCPQLASDTVFTEHTAELGAWAGQRVYIGFWHNSNDGDLIQLDHFLMTEADNVGLNETAKNGNKLFQNQPNPADKITTIHYNLGQFNDKVALEVFDVMGRKVHEVKIGEQAAGKHSIAIDASILSSGTYYYTLKTGDDRMTRKMIVTK